jgi:hypothetical protein
MWQKKFTDLQGNSAAQGDLKSVVLHNMTMASQKSTFPIALGVRITGVDDATFSQTGEAFSTITLPMADTHALRILQQDDTALAYEFVSHPRPGNKAQHELTRSVHRGRPGSSRDIRRYALHPLHGSTTQHFNL